MRVAFIGCGNIAGFHADALRASGAEIAACTYRSDLKKATLFRDRFGLNAVYDDWQKMLDTEKPDALWVTASWDTMESLLSPLVATGVPLFLEKPVALRSSAIADVIAGFPDRLPYIQVGYNRRFYSVVNTLRQMIAGKTISAIEVFIPENVKPDDTNMLRYRMIQNSSHLFDLVCYITGDFNITIGDVNKYLSPDDHVMGYMVLGRMTSGTGIYFSSVYNSPLNSAIRIYTSDEYIYELKPVEKLTIYKGFDIIEPGPANPIRLYNPGVIMSDYETGSGFKPGFPAQTKAFIEETFYGNNKRLPNLGEALQVTRIIEAIMEW